MSNVIVNEMKVVDDNTRFRGGELLVVGKLTVNQKQFDFTFQYKKIRFDGRETLEGVGFSFEEVDSAAAKMLDDGFKAKVAARKEEEKKVREIKWDSLVILQVYNELKGKAVELDGKKEDYVESGKAPIIRYVSPDQKEKIEIYISFDDVDGKMELFDRTLFKTSWYKPIYKTKNNVKYMIKKFEETVEATLLMISHTKKIVIEKQKELESLREILGCEIVVGKVWHHGFGRRDSGYETDVYIAQKGGRNIRFTTDDRPVEYRNKQIFSVAGFSFNLGEKEMKTLISML